MITWLAVATLWFWCDDQRNTFVRSHQSSPPIQVVTHSDHFYNYPPTTEPTVYWQCIALHYTVTSPRIKTKHILIRKKTPTATRESNKATASMITLCSKQTLQPWNSATPRKHNYYSLADYSNGVSVPHRISKSRRPQIDCTCQWSTRQNFTFHTAFNW